MTGRKTRLEERLFLIFWKLHTCPSATKTTLLAKEKERMHASNPPSN